MLTVFRYEGFREFVVYGKSVRGGVGGLVLEGGNIKTSVNVRVKSNRDQAPPPRATPGNLTFEKIIGQMPARTGRNHSQMPCYRGTPGSGILAKIKFNKHFKIKKNEK